LIINYAVMPSFVSAMYKREEEIVYVTLSQKIKGTIQELKTINEIEHANLLEGIVGS
jgi:hypothetical protein